MSERVAGQEFTADGSVWLCYLVRKDGIACSAYVGPVPNMQILDYSKGCSYEGHARGSVGKVTICSDYVVAGTDRCRKHQDRSTPTT